MFRERCSMCALLGGVTLLVAVGCAQTRHSRSVEKSGFLKDYSLLQPGSGDEALLRYENPNVDWSKYDGVVLESVELWGSENFKSLGPDERQMLTDTLYSHFYAELSKDIKIVKSAGPTDMVIRMAVTEAEASNVAMDTVTTLVPQLRLLNTLGGLATDKAIWVGEASVEVEITDGGTGEQLFLGVDKRVGTKAFRGALTRWNDVDEAYKFWAAKARKELAKRRSQ